MIQAELKELIDEAVNDAKSLIKKTQSRQAVNVFQAIKHMKELFETQDYALDELTKTCADAGMTLRQYNSIISAAEEELGPKAWEKVLKKAYKKECACQ